MNNGPACPPRPEVVVKIFSRFSEVLTEIVNAEEDGSAAHKPAEVLSALSRLIAAFTAHVRRRDVPIDVAIQGTLQLVASDLLETMQMRQTFDAKHQPAG